MYEFLVLGRLTNGPMHGYMIAKVLDNIIGPVKQVQWGALYPVLSRLSADGLIRVEAPVDEDGGSRKVYSITDAGYRRLHELLMDTEHHLGDYATLFWHKVSLFSLLQPEERIYLCRHYAVYAQQHVDHLLRRHKELRVEGIDVMPAERIEDVLEVMQHRTDFWRHELAWAENLLRLAAEAAPARKEAY